MVPHLGSKSTRTGFNAGHKWCLWWSFLALQQYLSHFKSDFCAIKRKVCLFNEQIWTNYKILEQVVPLVDIFGITRLFLANKCLRLKIFSSHNFIDSNFFWAQNFFKPKIFVRPNIFIHLKFVLDSKIFWSDFFWKQTFFRHKTFFWPINV